MTVFLKGWWRRTSKEQGEDEGEEGRMSRRLGTVEEARALEAINGVAVAVLDARCRPLPDRTQDAVHWRARSATGFLTETSANLIDVLVADWLCVRDVLHTTHTCLAAHLRALWRAATRPEALGSTEHTVPAFHRPDANPPVRLTLEIRRFNAPQWSPLGPLPLRCALSTTASATEATEKEPPREHFWDSELHVTNTALGLTVVVAAGVVDLVAELGFYEGGADNPYRVDPLLLAAALTYAPDLAVRPPWMAAAAARAEAVGEARAAALAREAAPLVARAQQDADAEAAAWLAQFHAHLDAQQAHERDIWRRIQQRLLDVGSKNTKNNSSNGARN